MGTTISRSTDAETVTPELVLNAWESQDEPGTIVHPILGSEWPDVTLRPAQARTGTLRLLFATSADAESARVFHRAPAVFLTASTLAWVPAAYVPAGPIHPIQQETRTRWILEVPFQEVAP